MIAINGKKVDLNKPTDSTAILFKKAMDAVKKIGEQNGGSIILTFSDDKISYSKTDRGVTVKEKSQGAMVPTKVMWDTGDQTSEVLYYENASTNSVGEITRHRPRYYDFDSEQKVFNISSQDKLELATFLLVVCPHSELIDFAGDSMLTLASLQNRNRKRAHFKLYSRQHVDAESAKVNRLVAQVQQIIWGGDGIGLDDEKMAIVAMSYEVPNVKTMSSDSIRNYMQEYVLSKDDRGKVDILRINNFIDACSFDASMKLRALVQEATDKKVIKYFGKSQRSAQAWHWIDSDGVSGDLIMAVRNAKDKTSELVGFLERNPITADAMRKALAVE